jgi:hypothetical protein
MGVAGELLLVGVVVDAHHVRDVLEVVGATPQGVGDALLCAFDPVVASAVQLMAGDEVRRQGTADRREDHREDDSALKRL